MNRIIYVIAGREMSELIPVIGQMTDSIEHMNVPALFVNNSWYRYFNYLPVIENEKQRAKYRDLRLT